MVNSLSAIIISPGTNLDENTSFSTMYRSETFPHHSRELNVTSPFGATPTNSLKVLECLYSDHVSHCAVRDDGFL